MSAGQPSTHPTVTCSYEAPTCNPPTRKSVSAGLRLKGMGGYRSVLDRPLQDPLPKPMQNRRSHPQHRSLHFGVARSVDRWPCKLQTLPFQTSHLRDHSSQQVGPGHSTPPTTAEGPEPPSPGHEPGMLHLHQTDTPNETPQNTVPTETAAVDQGPPLLPPQLPRCDTRPRQTNQRAAPQRETQITGNPSEVTSPDHTIRTHQRPPSPAQVATRTQQQQPPHEHQQPLPKHQRPPTPKQPRRPANVEANPMNREGTAVNPPPPTPPKQNEEQQPPQPKSTRLLPSRAPRSKDHAQSTPPFPIPQHVVMTVRHTTTTPQKHPQQNTPPTPTPKEVERPSARHPTKRTPEAAEAAARGRFRSGYP
ncbi:hypothetical protein BDK51DRAFT_33984 [Blyttiomyces helicus]|uniref:Uncharacterized protein n=1 Tax=Blyttiomyces helicus TaxID=388810 RepID=A0A4P9WQU3_9FUNG|nr:hypothetical protein BDK51DRAFT_33984 [Blyttiomyces helicus]|eukprot:RKO94563.1 hypothetical protein BDK51DRAFT_33984 [Blyttiomyces helicus]